MKNSILEPWQRLPFVTALFAAEASCILMNPSDVHYTAVNKFLFRAPGIDLEVCLFFVDVLWKVGGQIDCIQFLRI